jgi:hypothetical protein
VFFSTTFSIIFGLFGSRIFILRSNTFSADSTVATTLSLMVLSFAGSRTSSDCIWFISVSSFLGAVPSPDAFIHCWRILHITRERKQTRIWVCVLWKRSSFFLMSIESLSFPVTVTVKREAVLLLLSRMRPICRSTFCVSLILPLSA